MAKSKILETLEDKVKKVSLSAEKLGSSFLKIKNRLLKTGALDKRVIGGNKKNRLVKTKKNPLKKAERAIRSYYRRKYSIGGKKKKNTKKTKRNKRVKISKKK